MSVIEYLGICPVCGQAGPIFFVLDQDYAWMCFSEVFQPENYVMGRHCSDPNTPLTFCHEGEGAQPLEFVLKEQK